MTSGLGIATSLPNALSQRRGRGRGGMSKGISDLVSGIQTNVVKSSKHKLFRQMYRDDRVAFVYDCLPALRQTFAPYQEAVMAEFDMGTRRLALRGPHGLGKTLLAAILVHHMLLTTEDDCTIPTLASVWRQLDKFLWPEIHKIAKLLDWNVIGRDRYSRDELMVHSIRTNNGLSEAFAVAAGDATAIEGAHASRLMYIFDESKVVDSSMWDSAEGAFSTEGSTVLGTNKTGECLWFAISTPGGASGRFYEIHAKKEGLDDWKTMHVTIDEAIAAGRISPDWVAKRGKQWGVNSAVYKNRVLGEFATDATDGVIPIAWIEAAFARYEAWVEEGSLGAGLGARVIGVDSARFGDDKSVFAERIGNRLEYLHVYAKQAVTTTAGYLEPLAHISQAVNIEMDSGLGASIYDFLESKQDAVDRTMNLVDIYMGAGTTVMDQTETFRFRCVRDAAWWHMRELLDPENGHDILLCPNDFLLGDLAAPLYKIDYWHDNLCIQIENKDSLRKKERHGRSTDYGDACVLAYWEEVSRGGGVVF